MSDKLYSLLLYLVNYTLFQALSAMSSSDHVSNAVSFSNTYFYSLGKSSWLTMFNVTPEQSRTIILWQVHDHVSE